MRPIRKPDWQFTLGGVLILLSAFVYLLHYLIFRDAHHIFIYLLGDIAFVFIEVLMVTLIIHRVLNEREKQAQLKKMNMVIGAFFSEVGTELLKTFARIDNKSDEIRQGLMNVTNWSGLDFMKAIKEYHQKERQLENVTGSDLTALKGFLHDKRQFLLGLLENPNLLEHESFTELLWAVFHLTEELCFRKNVDELQDEDLQHITGDMKRAYNILISEWLAYVKHLKQDYPYLFSLAVRMNPFNPNASPTVKS